MSLLFHTVSRLIIGFCFFFSQGERLLISWLYSTTAVILISPQMQSSNTEEAEVEQFYEDLEDLVELTPKKDVLFIIGNWNAKVGSQETWSNRQIWPWSTK